MGHSCHVISTRLTRLLFNINIPSPNPEGILSTFGRSIQHWLEEFPTYSVEHHFEYARVSVWSVIDNLLITTQICLMVHRYTFRGSNSAILIFNSHQLGSTLKNLLVGANSLL